jgi:hypothetical protein
LSPYRGLRVRYVSGEPTTTDESQAVEWWTADEIRAKMPEVYAIRALDALAGGEPPVRLHDGVRLIQ